MTASRTAGRYNPDDPSLRYGVPVRHAALTAAASGIRVRRSRVPVEQILLIVAAILFPLGLAFVMLGWWGAAHTGRLYAQIDYLISGGLLGLGISVAGGFMYFGYWLSRQLNETRHQNGLTLQSLQRIEDLLDDSIAMRGGSRFPATNGFPHPVDPKEDGPAQDVQEAPVAAGVGARGAGNRRNRGSSKGEVPSSGEPTREVTIPDGPMLVATPRGSLLHRPDCPVVARRTDLRSIPAGTEGFGYCTMCDAAGVL
jgi:hypothetical protein